MSAKPRPQAAIFDVEGTLMDCVPLILESWRETLQEAGHAFTLRDLQLYSGMDGTWMLEQLLPHASEATRESPLQAQGIRIGIATTCKADELAIYDRPGPPPQRRDTRRAALTSRLEQHR